METKNFSNEETRCKCCGINKMDKAFMAILQELRDEYGKPMVVTSGYRCKSYNAIIGGVPYSQHLLGNAIDIACTDPQDRYRLISLATQYNFTGIEVSPTHIHLDIRADDPRLLWTDNKGRIA